jgi:transcriptional regulator with XRE-family HTH domain
VNIMPQDEGAFGVQLRRARLSRKLSQESLASAAGISARHMSFLETGRARPGRDVILRLGDALKISANQRNTLLRLAGFAPAFAPGDMAPDERVLAQDAISNLLQSQNPVPAVASDALGYVIEMNEAAKLLFSIDGKAPEPGDNLFEFFFSNERLRESIGNWDEVAPALLHHLEQEALNTPDKAKAQRLVTKIGRLAGIERGAATELPIFTFEIRQEGRDLRFVSNYSTFGTPYDATMQSIRIECFFPGNAETWEFLGQLAGQNAPASMTSAQPRPSLGAGVSSG